MSLERQYSEFSLEAGIDEAGRGCLAGPVVAAAVILPPDFVHKGLNDSKQLSHARRLEAREAILAQALAWNVGMIAAQPGSPALAKIFHPPAIIKMMMAR